MVFLFFILFYSSLDDMTGSSVSPIQRLMEEFMPNTPIDHPQGEEEILMIVAMSQI